MKETGTCSDALENVGCQMVDAVLALETIFNVTLQLSSCQDMSDIVQVTLGDFCGDNMSGIYFSYVGYLLAIIGLFLGLCLMIYFMSRYKPKGLLTDEEARIKNINDREEFRAKVHTYRYKSDRVKVDQVQ